MSMKRTVTVLCLILLWSKVTSATPYTVDLGQTSGSTGNVISASVTFDVIGSNLVIMLTNTGGEASAREDVLTGVFFNIAGSSMDLERVSALVDLTAPGSAILFEDQALTSNDVSGEWGFADNLVGAPGGGAYGLSASGYGDADLFGSHDLFDPTMDRNDHNLNGFDYGIVSLLDNTSEGSKAVTGNQAHTQLIQGTVVFTLGLPSDTTFDPSMDIFDVAFQYGADLDGPVLNPEPGSLLLLSTGLAILARRRWSAARRPPPRSHS